MALIFMEAYSNVRIIWNKHYLFVIRNKFKTLLNLNVWSDIIFII